jgi:hypothetical protein
MGQTVQENGPDAPCLNPLGYLGCIDMQACDQVQTWFCVGANDKPLLVTSNCGPGNAEMCDPMLPNLANCP